MGKKRERVGNSGEEKGECGDSGEERGECGRKWRVKRKGREWGNSEEEKG